MVHLEQVRRGTRLAGLHLPAVCAERLKGCWWWWWCQVVGEREFFMEAVGKARQKLEQEQEQEQEDEDGSGSG